MGFSDNDPLPYTGIDMDHHMSDSKHHPHHLLAFVQEPVEDPSKKVYLLYFIFCFTQVHQNFIPQLKAHLLGRMLEQDSPFSNEDLNSVRIVNDHIYSAKVLRINYTTYDMRRDQDSMNPRTHCDVMVHSSEAETDHGAHPFLYARVLGLFHEKVLHTGKNVQNRSIQHMEFLWVRWFSIEPGFRSGFKAARLPKIGFIAETKPNAFGFLDPSVVLRGCHLVPAFASGRTNKLLKMVSPTAACLPNETDDWANFYVIMWVHQCVLQFVISLKCM